MSFPTELVSRVATAVIFFGGLGSIGYVVDNSRPDRIDPIVVPEGTKIKFDMSGPAEGTTTIRLPGAGQTALVNCGVHIAPRPKEVLGPTTVRCGQTALDTKIVYLAGQ